MRDAPAAVDLFSGCGGLSAGLRAAGFRILAGLDIEPHAMDTFRLNFPEAYAAECDLAVPDPRGLMERAGLRAGELGLLADGPPCQGFSKNVPRARRTADAASNRLVRSFLAYAAALRPRAVLMENVAEMRKGFGGAWTREVRETLTAAGYRVLHATLDAADYGVPQHRRRAFFAAVRDGAPGSVSPNPPTAAARRAPAESRTSPSARRSAICRAWSTTASGRSSDTLASRSRTTSARSAPARPWS